MLNERKTSELASLQISKAPTGISGMDEISEGGLPKGHPTLVCGGPGCGKTLFATEFLVHGALEYDEPGVLVSFEENIEELIQNAASMGINLKDLIDRKKLFVEYIQIERSELNEAGEYDLGALFIRLEHAVEQIGAKRIALNAIEMLFAGFSSHAIVWAELQRLFRWFKEKKLTAVITAMPGETGITRYGLEEYISDCVILLDQRVIDQIATRRLRIIKYRGSAHGTNEYPFMIGSNGVSVLPITSMGLDYAVSDERLSSGVSGLDEMMEGKGYYRGSTILVSGNVGTGKSSLSAAFARAVCMRGERCLYYSFEESIAQIIRNMRSIGIDLAEHLETGRLHFQSVRPTLYGLEMHLVSIIDFLRTFSPDVLIVDSITDFISVASSNEVKTLVTRLMNYAKTKGITGLFTSLTTDPRDLEKTQVGISSQIDTWIVLENRLKNGQRVRELNILKSRGMAHSGELREYYITNEGIIIGGDREKSQKPIRV